MSASSRWAAVLTSPACPNVAPSDHPLLPHPGNSRYQINPHPSPKSLPQAPPSGTPLRCPKCLPVDPVSQAVGDRLGPRRIRWSALQAGEQKVLKCVMADAPDVALKLVGELLKQGVPKEAQNG
ncbi:g12339 [Coccomyxa viridis]|uniref:G12339 protein n=1 Tax=Coccomyxa viridis TaxID=1274662 RepID=A0ABP1GED2_9CHLO